MSSLAPAKVYQSSQDSRVLLYSVCSCPVKAWAQRAETENIPVGIPVFGESLGSSHENLGSLRGGMERFTCQRRGYTARGRMSRSKRVSNLTMRDRRPEEEPIKLTKREIEVLTLVIEGKSSKEVADMLYVSKRTVDFHLANIYDKLQVTNRVQAFRRAARLGLIPFDAHMNEA